MAGRSPWKISTLISACYEFVLALFLLFRMILALVILELTKYLPLSQACSCSSHRQRNLLPPSSRCLERNATRSKGTGGGTRIPARLPRGMPPERTFSEDLLASQQVGDHVSSRKRAGLSDRARSMSLSSVYKRKKRTPSLEDHALCTQECKGAVDGEKCKCIISEIDLYDDLIGVSSEYLKQKDRGHEEVILSLLKSLQAERRNLRTLYEELDEERIAAETAANEAMGMILRLQKEKCALQMEAAHYQRMAEERALHDEHAIQVLEEDLSRKESERLLLEEELSLLRDRCYGDAPDVTEKGDDASCFPEVGKPLLLLTGSSEAPQDEEDEIVSYAQNCTTDQKIVPAALEESLGAGQVGDQPLKRLKSFTAREQKILKDPSVLECTVERVLSDSSMHPEPRQLFNDEDDAKSILVQLSALEKQLFALEESERLGSLHQTQAQPQAHLFASEFLKADRSCINNALAENNDEDVSRRGEDARTSEADFVNLPDEEKVVDVDVANVSGGPYCESQVLGAEEIFEFHEGLRSRSKDVHWEACEEEKHLVEPSFVPASSSNTAMASIDEEMSKPDVECLPVPFHGMCEEERWSAKRVTLQDINMRLQALENESTLLRRCSAPSTQDQMSMVLLRDVMQELQELLKIGKSGSGTSEASPSSLNAFVKGGQHKKRQFSDGPGLFSGAGVQ